MSFPLIQPLVSVVIPSYACANSISAVLDGLLRQTYPSLEILIVNDDSPDDLEQKLIPYRDKIRYLKNPQNLGLSKTYNRGLHEAKGEFALTLHSDCVLEPEYIERLMRHMQEEPNLGAATGRCRYINFEEMGFSEQLFTVLNRLSVQWHDSNEVEEISFIEGKADLFRLEVLKRYGYFNEKLKITSEDQDLSAKMRLDNYRIIQDNSCVYVVCYNQTQDSILKVLRKQRTYACGQAYVLVTYGIHAIRGTTAARNWRALHRLAQLFISGAVILFVFLSLLNPLFVIVALAVLLTRFIDYFIHNSPLTGWKRIAASAIGLVTDFFYTVGMIEGTFKTLLKTEV